ncbi:hypothetical protein PR048_012314 [Dryococelus australis]|uniref:Uncharacterized protein n=1 Tax=Dryococelus australis TaxID=614101 RepID=A0ABQ9HPJ3_9NEOP|nr:hypothetical protein PR048_012314 [Dryococelus australis]
MQNLPHPFITTNFVLYSRQLWHSIFEIHIICDDSTTIYRYCEHKGKKGPNKVTSMLLDYMKHFRKDEIKELCEVTRVCQMINNFFNQPNYKDLNIYRVTSGLGCHFYCKETSNFILSPYNVI